VTAAAEQADAGLPFPRRGWAVGALSLGTGLLVVDNAIATVALPTVAEALGVAPSTAVVVVTVYQLVLLMALLPLSALGDRIGLRRMYQGGQVLFLVGALVTVTSGSLPHLLAGRTLQALGAAAALSVSSALLRSVYPASQLGRGLGLNGVIIATAATVAPSLGGLILAGGSWRWVFAAAAPFAVLSLLLGAAIPRPAPRGRRFDLLAAGLCAASFGLLFGGVELIAHHGRPAGGGALLAIGAVVLWSFIRYERRAPAPILPVDLLSQARFGLPAATGLIAFTASMAFMIGLPFRLQAAGMPPEAIGAVLAVWPLAMMASAALGGLMSDTLPRGVPGALGMALATAGLALAAVTPTDAGLAGFAPAMALGGAGYGLFISPNAHLMIGAAPRERAASMGALVSTSRLMGQTLGATLAAALLAGGLGGTPVIAAVAAVVTALAGAASLANGAADRRRAAVASEPIAQDPL